MNEEYSAGGVVYKRDEGKVFILFILDPYGVWALPKGHIEKGESKEEAAIREVSEETGIDAAFLKIIKFLDDMEFEFEFNGVYIHKIVNFFLIESDSNQEIKPQKEEKISKVKWVLADKAVEFAGYGNVKKLISKAIKNI